MSLTNGWRIQPHDPAPTRNKRLHKTLDPDPAKTTLAGCSTLLPLRAVDTPSPNRTSAKQPARQAKARHAGCFARPSSNAPPLRVIDTPSRFQPPPRFQRPRQLRSGVGRQGAWQPRKKVRGVLIDAGCHAPCFSSAALPLRSGQSVGNLESCTE